MVTTDPYLGDCVLHEHVPAVEVCIIRKRGTVRDFCATCIDEGQDEDHFGRCYECRDGLHTLCIGVPCGCPCPTPDQRRREELRRQALAKLTPDERWALGAAGMESLRA